MNHEKAAATFSVNGELRDHRPGITVRDLLLQLDLDPEQRGLAVAIGAGVVPRQAWERTPIEANARVEVIHAIGGG